MSEWARFKRLVEQCGADRDYLKEYLSEYSLEAEAVGIFYGLMKNKNNPYIAELIQKLEFVHNVTDKRYDLESIKNARFREWAARRRKRNLFESRVVRRTSRGLTSSVAFELSDGCSGNCPFCCFAAKPLESVFEYTGENAKQWREILSATKDVIGDSLASGVCYFATEPFDNPDYERFISDFHDISGVFPQTTTAAALRDIGRTRRFMSMLGFDNLKYAALRMSVTALSQLKRIHAEFTPEELACVELLLNNPESIVNYGRSGRAANLEIDGKGFLNVSSNCVSGFIVNLPRKTITLAEPHIPNEAYPLGMKIYAETSFSDSGSYKSELLRLINEFMPESMPLDKALVLNRNVTVRRKGEYAVLEADGCNRLISVDDEFFACLEAFTDGASVNSLSKNGKITEKIKFLYDLGYLSEVNDVQAVKV